MTSVLLSSDKRPPARGAIGNAAAIMTAATPSGPKMHPPPSPLPPLPVHTTSVGSSQEDSDSSDSDNVSLNSVTEARSVDETKGIPFFNDPNSSHCSNGNQLDSPSSGSLQRPDVVNRKESYKAQRKTYAREKKRVERELLSTFKDQSIIVLADWLKVRGTLKSWTKLWCVLKPGLLLLYRSHKAKSSHWIGTIILSTCELIERPSKKDGFCFKLFHPIDQSIWAARGPDGESLGAVVQPLPTSHLIFRAPNSAAGKCWMDALELALRCSSLLLRTMSSQVSVSSTGGGDLSALCDDDDDDGKRPKGGSYDESDVEKLFVSELGDLLPDDGENEDDDEDLCQPPHFGSEDSDHSEDTACLDKTTSLSSSVAEKPPCSRYTEDPNREVFGTAVDQTEEFSDENKSIVWFLVKQVRPGMDLSRVVLPTFILEPRSFLDKLTDYHYHNDWLSRAIHDESPYNRIKTIVKWYLSGFYKKPKGLKKPYNPILGEMFRCYWQHPNGSKTFYIAEQVSHHPPISAFYVANRQEGFTISSSILAKSKFYGNSTSAILEGTATLSLLPRGEEYRLTMPYAHCKGILMGTMTMELGGKVTIECAKTGYSTELEFKLRPFLGGGEFTNAVSGKIRLGKEVLATIDGHWDDMVKITEKADASGSKILCQVSDEVRQSRLSRFTIPLEDQTEFESTRLWQNVSKAIECDDQQAATEEKSILEEAQRETTKQRKALGKEWQPKFFQLNPSTNQYEYLHADLRAWDPLNDEYQYEHQFVISTKTKHRAPMIRTQSIINVSGGGGAEKVDGGIATAPSGGRPATLAMDPDVSIIKPQRRRKSVKETQQTNKSPDMLGQHSGFTIPEESDCDSRGGSITIKRLQEVLRPLEEQQRQCNERLAKVQHQMEVMTYQQRERDSRSSFGSKDLALLVLLVAAILALYNWSMSAHGGEQVRSDFSPPRGAPGPS